MNKTKGKTLNFTDVMRLNKRFSGSNKRRFSNETVVDVLLKNLHSQRILAEWQAVLRTEQEKLISQLPKNSGTHP